jgi:hypothetical protein
MKKIITIALALVLVLSLAACGGNSSGGGSSTTPPATSDNSTTPPANSSTTTPPSDTPDNSQSADNGDDSSKWPDNEYTQQVPTPSFTYTGSNTFMGTFMAEFSDLTIEGAKSYEEELIASGFSVDEALSTRGDNNAKIHLENSAGWIVEIMAYPDGNGSAIHITKP